MQSAPRRRFASQQASRRHPAAAATPHSALQSICQLLPLARLRLHRAAPGSPKGFRLASVVLAVLVAGAYPGIEVQAQPVVGANAYRLYDIPAGSLTRVLEAFVAQSGALVSIDSGLIQSRQSSGLQGSYDIQQGLDRILAPHQLRAVRDNAGIYTLAPLPAAASHQAVTQLDAVQVRADISNPKDEAYRAAQSVNVLTRDDIERFRGTSVGDIFQGIPGVLVGENRNSGAIDLNIRGMQGQGRVPVLVDGARQETMVSRGYSGVASRSYVDPDLIGGIRIEKGPTMDAGGTGATGGLVVMRTLNADDIVKEGEHFGMRLRGTAIGNNSGSPVAGGTAAGYNVRYDPEASNGSRGAEYRTDCKFSATHCSGRYDLGNITAPDDTLNRPSTFDFKGWAGSLALAQRFERVDLVAAYAKRSQGNYYAGKHGATPWVDYSDTQYHPFYTIVRPTMRGASRIRAEELVVNSNYESQSWLLKSRIYLPQDHELELSWLRYDSEFGQLMPSAWNSYGHSRQQMQASEIRANTYTLQYRHDAADNRWINLDGRIWATRLDSLNNNYAGEMEEGAAENPWITNDRQKYQRWGSDLSNTISFSSWGGGQVRVGLSAQSEKLKTTPLDANKADRARDADRNEYSGFVALKYTPLPSLTLDAGIRYTRYNATDHKGAQRCVYANSEDNAPVCTPVAQLKNSNSGSAPLVSLAWEPWQGLQFYGRYAEALRMASLFESTSDLGGPAVVDGSLRPEHTRNKEFGVSFMRDGVMAERDQLRLKLAYFRNFTQDYLTRTPTQAYEGGGGVRLRNIESLRLHGLELSGSYDIGQAYVEFGATRYNRIEVCHHGMERRVPCTEYGIGSSFVNNMIPPKWHASATLGARLFERRLTLGMRGTFMGKRTPVPEYDSQGIVSILAYPVVWERYKVFDLFASWKVNDSLSLDFNIDNITDRYYLDALGLGLVPAPGRTARMSATLQF